MSGFGTSAAALLIAWCTLGCQRPPADAEGDRQLRSQLANREAIRPSPSAGSASEATAVAPRPARRLDMLEGFVGQAVRYSATLTYRYDGPSGLELEVSETTQVDRASDGRYRLETSVTSESVDIERDTASRRAVYDGVALHTQLGGGRWLTQDLTRNEHRRWLDRATGHTDDILALLRPWLEEHRDRDRLVLNAKGSDSKGVPALDAAAQAQLALRRDALWMQDWRRHHRLQSLTGHLQAPTGADRTMAPGVVGAELRATLSTTRLVMPRIDRAGPEPEATARLFEAPLEADAGTVSDPPPPAPAAIRTTYTLTMTLAVRVTTLEDAPNIKKPAEAMSPRRERIQSMIDTLLGR